MATMNMRCASGVAAQQQATRQTPVRVPVSSTKPIVRLVPFQVRPQTAIRLICLKAVEDLARAACAEADTQPLLAMLSGRPDCSPARSSSR